MAMGLIVFGSHPEKHQVNPQLAVSHLHSPHTRLVPIDTFSFAAAAVAADDAIVPATDLCAYDRLGSVDLVTCERLRLSVDDSLAVRCHDIVGDAATHSPKVQMELALTTDRFDFSFRSSL